MTRLWLAALCAILAAPAGAGSLEVGSKAPAFELQGSDGREYTSSQFVGQRGVVLAWFPKAFTPG